MSSQEELAMLTDAQRIPKEQRMENAAAQIYAIQKGLEQGKRRGKKLKFAKSAMVLVTAAVMGVGLLFLNPSKLLPQQGTQIVETIDWGKLEPFKKLASFDVDGATVESAIRNNYVQIVNKSAEKNGYKITVNAVIADENAVILLYTASTTNDQEIFDVSSSKLTDVLSGRSIDSGTNSSGNMGAHLDNNPYEWYGKKAVTLDRNNPSLNQVIADFQIASLDPGKLDSPKTKTYAIYEDMRYSDRLKVNFTIDPKFWEQKTETVVLNQPIVIDGHEVNLAEVELSPLSIVAKYTLNDELKTDWEVRNKLFQKLPFEMISQVGKANTLIERKGGIGSEDGFISYYSSNILDHPKFIRLKIGNALANEEVSYIDIIKAK